MGPGLRVARTARGRGEHICLSFQGASGLPLHSAVGHYFTRRRIERRRHDRNRDGWPRWCVGTHTRFINHVAVYPGLTKGPRIRALGPCGETVAQYPLGIRNAIARAEWMGFCHCCISGDDWNPGNFPDISFCPGPGGRERRLVYFSGLVPAGSGNGRAAADRQDLGQRSAIAGETGGLPRGT